MPQTALDGLHAAIASHENIDPALVKSISDAAVAHDLPPACPDQSDRVATFKLGLVDP